MNKLGNVYPTENDEEVIRSRPVARILYGEVRRTASVPPVQVGIGVSLFKATTQGNVLISDGIVTQCFSPNFNLRFGLFVTVHRMFIFNLRQLVCFINSRLSHRSILSWTQEGRYAYRREA